MLFHSIQLCVCFFVYKKSTYSLSWQTVAAFLIKGVFFNLFYQHVHCTVVVVEAEGILNSRMGGFSAYIFFNSSLIVL